MTKKTAKRIFRKISPREGQRLAELRKELDEEAPELKRRASQAKRAYDTAMNALRGLREERERQGLSLADVRARSAISRESLCRMENDDEPNPTIRTLARYAEALGMTMEIRFAKKASARNMNATR